VSFSFKLDRLVARIALLVAVLLVCVASGRVIHRHFMIRVVDDNRLTLSSETLTAALTRQPNSPRINYRLARAEIAEGINQEQFLRSAQAHAESAVNLSLWDYRHWRFLATVQEQNGDNDSAEKSLRTAVKLAPNHQYVNWELANFLLRRGKLNESFEPFRKATKSNDQLLPLAFDLLWQLSGNDIDILKTMVSNNPAAQLSLVQFFLDQRLIPESLSIFRSIDRETRLKSSKSSAFINSLIVAGQPEAARTLWMDLIATSGNPETEPSIKNAEKGNLIWNEGFESNPVPNYDQFDWTVTPSTYARFGFDPRVARGGSRSLKVAFTGRDTTTLKGEIKQLVLLQPGVRYHLECYAKAVDLTPEGPRIALLGQNGVIVTSEPVAGDRNDWQLLTIDFVAPDDSSAKFVAIVRIPKYSYDEPMRGSIWFDDFSLTEQ
jgi:tetratricopeptide (TPR) repeat protein